MKFDTVFTLKGKQDTIDENGQPILLNRIKGGRFYYAEDLEMACAKSGPKGLFIKVSHVSKTLYDPVNQNNVLFRSFEREDKKLFDYKPVSSLVFNTYLQFLKNFDAIAYDYANRTYINENT